MRYQPQTGFMAWLLMRITGVGIVIFLPIHVWGLQTMLSGPEAFNRYIQLYSQPVFNRNSWNNVGDRCFNPCKQSHRVDDRCLVRCHSSGNTFFRIGGDFFWFLPGIQGIPYESHRGFKIRIEGRVRRVFTSRKMEYLGVGEKGKFCKFHHGFNMV